MLDLNEIMQMLCRKMQITIGLCDYYWRIFKVLLNTGARSKLMISKLLRSMLEDLFSLSKLKCFNSAAGTPRNVGGIVMLIQVKERVDKT